MSERGSYQGMLGRCYCVSDGKYAYYGGRGITVCEAWRGRQSGFATFLKDMGPKPSPLHTLDRIDYNGNYEPNNCRWATRAEQSLNRSNSIRIDGLPAMEWCMAHGLAYRTVYRRYKAGERGETLARPTGKFSRATAVRRKGVARG